MSWRRLLDSGFNGWRSEMTAFGHSGVSAGSGGTVVTASSMIFKGAWSVAAAYAKDNIVSYNGAAYIAIASTTGNLPTDAAFWSILASKGDAGSAGTAGATGDRGLTWRAAYDAATAYAINDAVSYSGSAYIAVAATTGNDPTNATYWSVLASKGDAGAAGTAGTPGTPGLVWRGAWASGTAYAIGDAVSNSGSAYICIAATSSALLSDAAFWSILASKGDAGSAGTAGATGDRGLTWRAAYDAATAYAINDAVSYSGSAYIAVAATTGNDPTNATYWSVLASKGDAGAAGTAGTPGTPGLVWRGAWASGTAYAIGDAVSNSGSAYICIAATSSALLSDAAFWSILASKGDAGSAGTAGATGDRGLTWRAAYDAATAYAINDAVSYSGSAYIAVAATTGNDPTNATYWSVLASKGDAGAAGTAGTPGTPGLVWRGAWASGTAYAIGDAVSNSGSAYICIAATSSALLSDAAFWSILASKGDAGSAGTAGATGDRGLTWRAAYDAATAYAINDAVSYSGSAYIAVAATTGNDPTNATYWSVLASKGDAGAAGTTWKGTWASGTSYTLHDLVYYAGSTYICVMATSSALPTDAVYWSLFSSIGATGNTGTTGITGLNWQGAWVSTTAYLFRDAVQYNGAAYYCTVANTGNAPTNASYWSLLSAGGPEPNLLINGGFRLWQRQVPTTATARSDGAYGPDRWIVLSQNGANCYQATGEALGQYCGVIQQSSATASKVGFVQFVEAGASIPTRGSSVTLSARISSSAAITARYAIIGWTGTADSVTRDIVNNWTSTTYSAGNFFIANAAVLNHGSVSLSAASGQTVTLTANVTSSVTNLAVIFWSDTATAQSQLFAVHDAGLYLGSTAPTWSDDPAGDLEKCLRYFEKSYAQGVAPGTAAVTAGLCSRYISSTNGWFLYAPDFDFSVPKRCIPTVTIYSFYNGLSGYAAEYSLNSYVAGRAAQGGNASERMFSFSPTAGDFTINTSTHARFQWTADAEL